MAHKHNRRRTRPRNRDHNTTYSTSADRLITLQPGITTEPAPPNISARKPLTKPILIRHSQLRPSEVTAKQWQNRYTAWQARDKAQIEEAAKLEAEQIKLFGGEPGDDVGLCYRMLEYFGGLDYIDN